MNIEFFIMIQLKRKNYTLENIDKDFFGIIENCFDGMSYQEYLLSLHQYSDLMINYLDKQFDFSKVELEEL